MKKIVLILIVIAVAVGLYLYSRPRPQTLVLTGTVDGNEVMVGAQITGLITRLAVEDGQRVTPGELLATLDAGVQQADVSGAAAGIVQADANARQSEAQTELLAQTLPTKVAQAEAQLAQAQAQLAQAKAQVGEAQASWDKAETNYVRTVPLAAKGVSSPLELADDKADVDSAQASKDAAAAGAEAAERAVVAAQSAVSDAKNEELQIGVQRQQTQSYTAAARQAQFTRAADAARLDQTQVVAPVGGVITLRAARQGEVVNPGNPIVTIFDLGDTWVDADVEETYAPLISLGETLQVKLASGQMVSGPVIYKAVEADFATQRDVSRTKRDIKTVAIRVRVNNPNGQLALGMTAWVLLPVPADIAQPPTAGRS